VIIGKTVAFELLPAFPKKPAAFYSKARLLFKITGELL
jgi:hypothetical protein